MTIKELVSYVKYLRPDESAQSTYGEFVLLRGLKPEIDMTTFKKLFNSAIPNSFITDVSVDFSPTHIQKSTKQTVQVSVGNDGIKHLIFESGYTGTMPSDKYLSVGCKFTDEFEKI
jgi:hypothetical protein